MNEPAPIIGRLIHLIRAAKLDLSDEKRAQADLASVLTADGVVFAREVPLPPAGIVDFLVGGRVIELKLRARKKQVYAQMKRYAQHPDVHTLILASNTSMGFPPQINGKDCYFIKLGEAWL